MHGDHRIAVFPDRALFAQAVWQPAHDLHADEPLVQERRFGLFRRLKGFHRIFSRFEKLDVMFVGFISFALIADGLRLC